MDRYQDCRFCGIACWTESNVPGLTDEQGRNHQTFGGSFFLHLPTRKIFEGHLVDHADLNYNISEGSMTNTDLDFLLVGKDTGISHNYHFQRNPSGIWVGESGGWLDGYSREDDQGNILRYKLPARCKTFLMEDSDYITEGGVPRAIFRGSCLDSPQGLLVIGPGV